MGLYGWIGLGLLAYLALLARSAWKQGELAQFARSLMVFAGLFAVLAVVAWTFGALG